MREEKGMSLIALIFIVIVIALLLLLSLFWAQEK